MAGTVLADVLRHLRLSTSGYRSKGGMGVVILDLAMGEHCDAYLAQGRPLLFGCGRLLDLC